MFGSGVRSVADSGGSGQWQSLLEAVVAPCLRGNLDILLVRLPSRVSAFILLLSSSFLRIRTGLWSLCGSSDARVVNEPLESISVDLGFAGNTLAEGDFLLSCGFMF